MLNTNTQHNTIKSLQNTPIHTSKHPKKHPPNSQKNKLIKSACICYFVFRVKSKNPNLKCGGKGCQYHFKKIEDLEHTNLHR